MAYSIRVRRAALGLGVFALVAAGVVGWASAPVAATVVSNETTFRDAWTNTTETQIDLDADISLTCTDGAGNGVSVRPVGATGAITVNGHGHSIIQTCTTGTNNGVLEQDGSGALTLENLTITGGNTASFGGGVRAVFGGSLTVTNSTISDNTGSQGGGGIIGLSVTVTNSTISRNHAKEAFGDGGGIHTLAGSLVVTNSTISDNTAGGEGGGINGNTNSLITVTNSTISGNTAGSVFGGGGGVAAFTSLNLLYATVVDNTAGTGVASRGANVRGTTFSRLSSFASVVALPRGGANCTDLEPTISNGFNFSDDASCGFTAATDRVDGDPNLGALANNGGNTLTRQPQSGSALIDAIPTGSCQADGASGITTDQRGLPRPSGNGCDIGAVEVQMPLAPTPVQTIVRFTG